MIERKNKDTKNMKGSLRDRRKRRMKMAILG
jgi:hypothetical protein